MNDDIYYTCKWFFCRWMQEDYAGIHGMSSEEQSRKYVVSARI